MCNALWHLAVSSLRKVLVPITRLCQRTRCRTFPNGAWSGQSLLSWWRDPGSACVYLALGHAELVGLPAPRLAYFAERVVESGLKCNHHWRNGKPLPLGRWRRFWKIPGFPHRACLQFTQQVPGLSQSFIKGRTVCRSPPEIGERGNMPPIFAELEFNGVAAAVGRGRIPPGMGHSLYAPTTIRSDRSPGRRASCL